MTIFYKNIRFQPKKKIDEILELLFRGESVTSLWIPGIGRTWLAYELQSKAKLLAQDPDKRLEKMLFLHLDLSLSEPYFSRQLEEILEMYSTKIGIRNKLKDLLDQGNQVVFILDNFHFNNPELLKYLYSFRQVDANQITFLILALESDFYPETEKRERDTLMSHNIVLAKYFTKLESDAWFEMVGKNHEVSLSKKEKTKAYEYCAGIAAFMIVIIKSMAKGISFREAFESKEMQKITQTFWEHFSQRERYVMKTIAVTGKLPPYTKEIKYLKEHRMLDEDNQIKGEWIEKIISKKQKIIIELKGENIIWDNIYLNEKFTEKELKVLFLLLKKNGKIVDRDEVADQIWGEDSVNKYSDWAIDQLFSRLRKKLEVLAIGGEVIKTVKGRGFRMEDIEVRQ